MSGEDVLGAETSACSADFGAAPGSRYELAARSLAAAVRAGVQIDADALQIGPEVWAVHGVAAYDGEIIVAEFDDLDSAQRAVDWAASFAASSGQDPLGPQLFR